MHGAEGTNACLKELWIRTGALMHTYANIYLLDIDTIKAVQYIELLYAHCYASHIQLQLASFALPILWQNDCKRVHVIFMTSNLTSDLLS